ncbi:3-methyladenine DNA glycosylase AlkD [Paenarthrobacter nitroguajacolicus]|uniref:DNA alkylation repair protein n=1 Tax=Paenarthrobacter nitroguajacolicus TaxID=211146 RepID=UPI0028605B94|nr:DNA alkylation repair protein [Paenarthrobacter nitroguajacolicus]MDR6987104.1 3-methyladenine DNA glycosylase AlkD [Paenarthrobacter nitroguajacolicus]
MSEAGDFVDYTLQMESTWEKAAETDERLNGSLKVYGASIGAVRGTVRDALKKFKDLDHDDITALSSELWEEPVFERRLAAVVLLQTKVKLLVNTDLTRIEGFIRQAGTRELVDPLAKDVVRALMARLEGLARDRAHRVLERWAEDPDPELRHAAAIAASSP